MILPKVVSAPDFLDGHFEHAILVNRAGEYLALFHFLNRQRLAGDGGLIHENYDP